MRGTCCACCAAGYLLKDAIAEQLELAVRAVARGDLYLSPTISSAVVQRYLASAEEIVAPHDVLTPR
jgi:DNA-binding NarL/FixJ family response regulator